MSPPQEAAAAAAATVITATVAVPGRGRGRVVPRKRDDGTVVPGAAAAAALVPAAAAPPPPDAPAERALALGQGPWRARRSLRSGGAVARFSSIAGAKQALRRGEPVVLVGARLSSLVLSSPPSAVVCGSGGVGQRASILTSAPGLDRFFEFDAAKNADPGAYYHVRYPETAATACGPSAAGRGGDGGGDGAPGGNDGSRVSSSGSSSSGVGLGEWLARASSWVETRTLCRALLGVWGRTHESLTFVPNAAALREASCALRAETGGSGGKGAAPAPGRRPRLTPRDLLDWPRVWELLGSMLAEDDEVFAEGSPIGAARQQKQQPSSSGGSLWLEACNPAAGRAALLPMRALPFARVVAQVSGCRRVVLVDPLLTYGDAAGGAGGVRPYPFAHPLEGYSGRSWEEEGDDEEEGGEEGAGAGAGAGAGGGGGGGGESVKSDPLRGVIAELGPCDALVVPAFWWAHQELLQPAGGGGGLNAALELGFDGGGGGGGGGGGESGVGGGAAPALVCPPLSAGALRAQAARLAEGLLAASLGAPAVARCLTELAAAGRPGQPPPPPPPPPPTARAHDRALACGEAFGALVEACLAAPLRPLPTLGPMGRLLAAEAQARALCAAMTDSGGGGGGGGGRLRPTRALDAAAAARLAAAAPGTATAPRRWLVEEDAEAARFPTLFRHRLLGAREDWKRHATELPLLLHTGAAETLVPPRLAAPKSASALAPDNEAPPPPPPPPPLNVAPMAPL